MACLNLALVGASTALFLDTCVLWPREMWLLEPLSNKNLFSIISWMIHPLVWKWCVWLLNRRTRVFVILSISSLCALSTKKMFQVKLQDNWLHFLQFLHCLYLFMRSSNSSLRCLFLESRTLMYTDADSRKPYQNIQNLHWVCSCI